MIANYTEADVHDAYLNGSCNTLLAAALSFSSVPPETPLTAGGVAGTLLTMLKALDKPTPIEDN